MNLLQAIRLALLTGAFTLGTIGFGWITVPLLGITWAALAGEGERPEIVAGCAATLAWALLLAWTGLAGPLWALVEKLGGVTGLPGVTWIIATLFFPFALAWSASIVGRTAMIVRR